MFNEYQLQLHFIAKKMEMELHIKEEIILTERDKCFLKNESENNFHEPECCIAC
ncbi:hypothetical protein JOC86_000063 [Bacillus pakistanensis]|uniref:Uncharacterized protein n=1 Tax=Rossellomorea pakistanensis TaxID=992288 RepID=A0ABS2N7F6_9BACI|nr:hypothetical protein [Bacillus pakistanensis]MBM7583526.1 hypothetical protein [Bacillus pakistanensis]